MVLLDVPDDPNPITIGDWEIPHLAYLQPEAKPVEWRPTYGIELELDRLDRL